MKKWTPYELEALGYQRILIGVPGRPFPVMVPNPHARGQADAYRLEVIEDAENPISIWSMRSYEEVIGLIYRNLPTPSMLPLFFETLQLMQLENDRRIQFYIGKHGSGKSFVGRMIGEMLHPDGAITINCADRDLNELLFETVLDVSANPDLFTKINEKLRNGTMNTTSIAALRSVVGDAFQEKDGHPQIDFHKIGAVQLEVQENADGQQETEAVFSHSGASEVVEVLLKIAEVEGLGKEASFMPLKSQLGILPRIWQEGRVAHLEEYNKCKEGSDTALHPVLQVLNGENAHCKVYGAGGMSFTFANKDRQPGFFCYLDGNMKADGVSTHTLSASANDRILPNIIQDMIQDDWQHRWSQLLTGLPIRVLYECKRDQWDEDPDSFTRFLRMIRGLGGKEVPASHLHYINRWEDVLAATEMIARYNYLYDQMTNPDSPDHQQGKYPELFSEVDEDFHNMAGGSMRRNIYYFKMALLGRPQTVEPQQSQGFDLSDSWSRPPQVDVPHQLPRPELNLGTHIANILYRDMVRLTLGLGKINLYTRLKAEFETLRLVKPQLNEGMGMDTLYFEDLLNAQQVTSERYLTTQQLLCDALRERLPGAPLSDDNDHLMTQGQIETALQKAANLRYDTGLDDTRLTWLHVQQYPPLVTVDNLLGPVAVLDSVPTQDGHEAAIPEEELLAHDRFLLALGMPKTGPVNLEALWNNTLLNELDSPLAGEDEALMIAANCSQMGIALTTVMTRLGNGTRQEQQNGNGSHADPAAAARPAIFHILWDKMKHQTLITGPAITEKLQQYLKEADIEYVNRNQANANTRVQIFLNRLFIKRPGDLENHLVGAWFYRNRLTGIDLLQAIEQLETIGIAELMVTADQESLKPLYATALNFLDRQGLDAVESHLARRLLSKV